jgi:3-methyladenine DNA glycosylase Tag
VTAPLRPFDEIFADAARIKGGDAALEALFSTPRSPEEIAAIPDDRWLAEMTKRVFQAGFSWDVIEAKWPRFEAVFDGFDIGRMRMMSDDDIEACLKADGIVRNLSKIRSIRENAIFLSDFAAEGAQGAAGGTVGARFASWPPEEYAQLLLLLKQKASRMGFATAGFFLRFMGVDGFVLSGAVSEALVREGVVSKTPTSRRDLLLVQEAFNTWKKESGRPLMHISRTLAATSP